MPQAAARQWAQATYQARIHGDSTRLQQQDDTMQAHVALRDVLSKQPQRGKPPAAATRPDPGLDTTGSQPGTTPAPARPRPAGTTTPTPARPPTPGPTPTTQPPPTAPGTPAPPPPTTAANPPTAPANPATTAPT